MKFQKKKDIKSSKNYSKYELKKIYSKYLMLQIGAPSKTGLISSNISSDESNLQEGVTVLSSMWKESLKKSYKIPSQSSKIRLSGRCMSTNRPRSVSQLFRISRQECRSLALDGQIPGITSSSW